MEKEKLLKINSIGELVELISTSYVKNPTDPELNQTMRKALEVLDNHSNNLKEIELKDRELYHERCMNWKRF